MRVTQLKLANFRGIRSLTLEFTNQTTVLVGINGVGKSTILDALALMFRNFVTRLGESPESRARKTHLPSAKDLRNGATELEIQVDVCEDDESYSLRGKYRSTVRSRLAPSSSGPVEDEVKLSTWISSIRRSITYSQSPVPLLVQYTVNRGQTPSKKTSETIHSPLPQTQLSAYEDALPAGVGSFSAFYMWFREREDLENEEIARSQTYTQDHQLTAVRDAIEALLEGFSNLRIERRQQRMTIQKGNETLDVMQLSEGEKALLTLVGDLARRLSLAAPGHNNPRMGRGIVLIDEIDLHLHPRWQRKVLTSLERTFPNCQFIVTTHSPQVLSEVKPECIYILERKDEDTIVSRPESSFGLDSNRILEDLMGVDERPRHIKDKLRDLFRLIDEGNLEEAKSMRSALEEELGSGEPMFSKADVLIRRKEILPNAPHRPKH